MQRHSSKLSLCLALLLNLTANSPAMAADVVDDAIKRYYAGYPAEAIEMLRPIASAGDAGAQYLLGNILYTLSSSGKAAVQDDPADWYRMAAAQDSAPANYALGAIHNNRWLQFHDAEDANLAQSYFERAGRLGNQQAAAALAKLQSSRNTASLSYTNDSFSSKRAAAATSGKAPLANAQSAPKTALTNALSGFQSSGDAAADARNLQRLLGESAGNLQSAEETTPNLSTLMQMLGNFESIDELINDIINLYQHIETASELDTTPGSN